MEVEAKEVKTALCSTKPNKPTTTAPASEVTAKGNFSLRNKVIITIRIIPINTS